MNNDLKEPQTRGGKCQAEADVREAKAEVKEAIHELEEVEHKLERAEEELEERHHQIDVTVDGKVKHVQRGTYLVSIFKTMVEVSADRELDILKDGVLHPLTDDEKITPHECEVFVSHVRTGSSA